MHTYEDFSWVAPSRLQTMALDPTPWKWYLDTTVYFDASELSGTVFPVDAGSDDCPPLGPLHVITAVQPQSEPDRDENLARMDVLDRELGACGVVSIRAVGSSVDRTHSEESRAVFGLDDIQARNLGRRFGQVAIFSWAGPQWSLLASVGDRATHRFWRWEASM